MKPYTLFRKLPWKGTAAIQDYSASIPPENPPLQGKTHEQKTEDQQNRQPQYMDLHSFGVGFLPIPRSRVWRCSVLSVRH